MIGNAKPPVKWIYMDVSYENAAAIGAYRKAGFDIYGDDDGEHTHAGYIVPWVSKSTVDDEDDGIIPLMLSSMFDDSLSPPQLEHLSSDDTTTSTTSSSPISTPPDTALVPLHGVTLAKLLSNNGEAFYYKNDTSNFRIHKRRESELLYALSEPVDELDEFISHSWNADPNVVLWTMHLRVNFWLAVTISIICTILLSWGLRMSPGLSAIVGILIYVTVLARGHEIPLKIPGVRRHSEAKVFFDRCCIDQVDPVRKAAGIRSIGAYLNKCDTFLLLWSDDYFQRLWCVFELACFLKGSERMAKQRPLKLFMMPIQKTVYRCLLTTTVYWLLLSVVPSCAQLPIDIVMCMVQVRYVFLGDITSRIKIRYSLSEIDFNTVQCTEPSDRAMILDLIEVWYGSLSKFKTYVSDKMCVAAKEAVSSDRLMLHICCVSQPAVLYGLAHRDMVAPALYACRTLMALVVVIKLARRFCRSICPRTAQFPVKLSLLYRVVAYAVAVIGCMLVDIVGAHWLVLEDTHYYHLTTCTLGVIVLLFTPAITFSSTVSALFGDGLEDGQQCWKWLLDECSV
ncbi:hypothetical protein FOZ61_007346 [Perkinsus olseni]|uniref:Uncharacterized protein n=1 Tax=Perkinsus olseni TaxID=32597 RepID=A0A7J6L9F2_PEROL|nr:hypothetical protein FOZ61_007346 [Perkinsus olseni]